MVIAVKAESWRELGQAIMRVHFNTMIFTATFIRRFESAVVGWAAEGEKLVETIAEALECPAAAVRYAV